MHSEGNCWDNNLSSPPTELGAMTIMALCCPHHTKKKFIGQSNRTKIRIR